MKYYEDLIFFAEVCLSYFYLFLKNCIALRERGRGEWGEKEILTFCSTYLCIHWLILICAWSRDSTCNLGKLGGCSNQLPELPGQIHVYHPFKRNKLKGGTHFWLIATER